MGLNEIRPGPGPRILTLVIPVESWGEEEGVYEWLGEGLLPPSSGLTSALLDPNLGGMPGGSRSSRALSVLGSSSDLHPSFWRHKEGKQLPCLCWSWYRSGCGLQVAVRASESTPEMLDESMLYAI